MPEKATYRIVVASGAIRYYVEEAVAKDAWDVVRNFNGLPGASAKLQMLNDDGVWKTIDGFGWFTELGD